MLILFSLSPKLTCRAVAWTDQKFTRAQIEVEYERNKEIGIRLGCWKGSTLVYDDDGKVLAELLAAQET